MTFIPVSDMWQRRQTDTLIRSEGVPISLIRQSGSTVRSAAGGYVKQGSPVTLPPVMRFMGTQGREQFVQLEGQGTGAKLKQYLLGPYGDDIRQNDQFVDPITGKTFIIEYVHDDKSVETRAEIKEVT